jgi:hypothetical protein
MGVAIVVIVVIVVSRAIGTWILARVAGRQATVVPKAANRETLWATLRWSDRLPD